MSQRFPASHTVGIGVAIDISWNETNERHHADLLVEDADGTAFESPRVGIDFETGRPPGHPVGTDQRLVFAVNGPIEIPRPGSYSIVLRVSETELGRTRSRSSPSRIADLVSTAIQLSRDLHVAAGSRKLRSGCPTADPSGR